MLLGVIRFLNHACDPVNNVIFVQKKDRQIVKVRNPFRKVVQKLFIFDFTFVI